jgi:hypothetical protein
LRVESAGRPGSIPRSLRVPLGIIEAVFLTLGGRTPGCCLTATGASLIDARPQRGLTRPWRWHANFNRGAGDNSQTGNCDVSGAMCAEVPWAPAAPASTSGRDRSSIRPTPLRSPESFLKFPCSPRQLSYPLSQRRSANRHRICEAAFSGFEPGWGQSGQSCYERASAWRSASLDVSLDVG